MVESLSARKARVRRHERRSAAESEKVQQLRTKRRERSWTASCQ